MVVKLYGSPTSTCTRLVAVVCKEKNIDLEIVRIDLRKGEQKSKEFVAKQPFGQIPYLDEDGFAVYESRAIARYLIKKYPNQGTQGLIPTDPKQEALFEQAVSIEAFNFNPFASAIITEKVFKKFRGLEPNEAVVKERLDMLNAKLDAYDVILGKQKYLAGDNLTLADLQHLPYGTLLATAADLSEVFTSRPNVARWWNDIFNRPTWQDIVQNFK
ncbi:glutathione S-transferase [Scleroderma yunnanense]